MRLERFIFIVFILSALLLNAVFGQGKEKLGQTGMQFLSVASDARAAGLGQSVTALEMRSSSLFFNPAGMAGQASLLDVSLIRNNWIAGIFHNAIAVSVAPSKGLYGVFGLSLLQVDYGDIQGTVKAGNERGYIKTGPLSPSSYAIGIGYARSLTEKFSIGGQIKMVHQNLGQSVSSISDSILTKSKNELSPQAFDFGTRFKTGYKSLVFAMSVRNFSPEVKYVSESFQLPLEFSIGVSMNLMDFWGNAERHSLMVLIDAVHYRSRSEQINIGMEYTFRKMVLLRIGYRSASDENNISFGMGLNYSGFSIDYAYTPYGIFNNVQRFTFRFSI